MKRADLSLLLARLKSIPSESLETDVMEFKLYSSEQALHNSKDLAEEICALANTSGGCIVIGVKDSSDVLGSDWSTQLVGFPEVDVHTTQERLTGKLRPKLRLDIYQELFEDKNYLVINVDRNRSDLVSTTSGKVCVRDGKSSRAMEPNEITDKVKTLQDYDWSSEILEIDPSEALDDSAVSDAYSEFVEARGAADASMPSFLEAIGATSNGLLTKAGLLFLGKREVIRKALGNFEYRFSRKTRSGELPINDVWDECIWNTVERAKGHFEKCNTSRSVNFRKKNYRVQLLDRIAFHEAFLNALVHRDYSLDGMVSVEFLDDSLAINSPGKFYGGVQPSNIFRHLPRHRNKALAKLMMEYHLVDRAGMGVLRMGINSLRYGREFPVFEERSDSVVVTMQAQYFRASVFIMSEDYKNVCGIVEFMILNSICDVGHVAVSFLEARLAKIIDDPWVGIQAAVEGLPCLELCGDNSGVYVRVRPEWNKFFEVQKTYRLSRASVKYVNLYNFLKRHGTAANADIKKLLGHAHASQTSRFLKDAAFVERSGKGSRATWALA